MNNSLNHIYRVVWNASLGLWQVASEVARSGGKTQSEQRKARRAGSGAAVIAGGVLGLGLALPGVAFAQLPTGGQVVGGLATIVQSGNALNINQGTDRAAIDWQSFNVGQGNTVNFNQPSASSIALNRVLGNDVSVIQGAINANGQVFLVNQNGILFTPTAQVNVGGIVASTQNISTADFMAGKHTFSGSSTGTVENQGNMTTSNGGTVALIAAKIINTGTITAPQGTVGLAAGNTVTLDLGGPVKIQVTQGALNTAIEQGGGIVADGGQIYLTAKAAGNLAASVINHTGITRARTLAGNQKGQIILIADMEVGTTTVAGTLDASAPNGGDGGFIETSAANVKIQDGVNITTQSAQGNNGQWLIDPHDFTIAASGGDITGAALGTALANNSVTIQTLASSVSCTGATCGTGKADGNGDIFVNDNVTWSSSSKLTLRAHRNIAINRIITASGATGSLALEFGQGSTNGAGSNYFIAADAKVNLQTGQNFSTKQGSAGTTRNFTVINALGAQGSTSTNDLQGIAGNTAGNYALGADIEASATSGWNSGQGFAPISNFTGQLDGLGHKITNLTINQPNNGNGVGLFRNLNTGAAVQHLGLTNVSITGQGNAGGIAGTGNTVLIRNSYTTGSISCVNNGIFCGGILGSQAGASLQSVYSNATVNAGDTAGGLVGNLSFGTISDSYATGTITTVGGATGGLIGQMEGGTVNRSFATGRVTSSDSSVDGGFVGFYTGGTITASFWDTQTSMTNNGVGPGGNSPGSGITGRTTADMQKITTFQNAGWNITGRDGTYPMLTFSSDSVWKIGPTTSPVFIRLDCGLCESIYGETPQFSFKAFTAASGGTAVTDAMLTGTALYSLTNSGIAAGTELGRLTDAGTYSVTYTSGLTGSSMYELSAGAATNFTIKPKLLTVAIQAALGSPLSKVYDGNQNIALSANNFVISGFVDQQGTGASVSGVTTGTFNNANVAQANTITAELGQNSIVLPQTVKASNYTLPTTASGAGTITPKALSITTNEFVSSTTANAAIASTNGLVTGQSVGALNLDGKNLSVAFGENTLASNYATTVVVPGAAGADLAVNRDLSLASGLSLTLRSDKNIVVNKVIDATAGPGSKVTLEFGQGAVAQGNTAEYVMNLVDTTFNGKINLLKGQNFATQQGSDGEVLNYTVITELGEQGSTTGTDLQGINQVANGPANLAGRYVLGADIDATVTNTWNVNNQGVAQGFNPIYTPPSGRRPNVIPAVPFSGTFDGLGHTVKNFMINRDGAEFVGLFGQSTGHIRNVGLSGGSVKGFSSVGALVGQQTGGSISNVFSTASVSGSINVGGLVGSLQNAGIVRHARSSGVITGGVLLSTNQSTLGGLIGFVTTGSTVAHSHASGNVSAPNSRIVGGLVGAVSSSTLTDVSATGHVTGRSDTGGLIGSLSGSTLSRAFASGAVNGPAEEDNNTIAYGGLVGVADNSTISDVFATGAANAGALRDVGGLVGVMGGGSLTNGYATGAVMGTTRVGSLIGLAVGSPTLSNSFWNPLTTGRDNAVGSGELSATSMGNASKTTAQLQNAFTFIDAGWNFETVWGKSITGGNGGNMQLRSFTNDNFDDYVKVADSSKVYGAANSTITGAAVSGVGAANVTASFGSAVGDLSDAGEYLYSTENVLNVTNKVAGRSTFVDRAGKLTITPKALTVALQAAMNNPLTKVYDGNENLALSSGNFVLSGFVGQQGVGATLGGVTSGTFNSKNVLQATTVSADLSKATFSATGEGFKASNYSLPTTPATAAGTITAKGIAVSGLTAQNKTYDGNRNAVVTGTAVVDTTGVIQGDTVNVTGTVTGGLFADKDAGNDKAVSVSGLSLSGTDAGNYAIAPTNLKANIAQKALTISGTTVANKDYDGNTNATVTVGTLSGVVEGETLGATTAIGQFAGKDVVRNAQGTAAAQNVTVAYTLANGTNTEHKASNYTLASETKTATINPKALSIAGSTVANKTYDGNTVATVTAGTLSGLVQGETLGATTATGQFADKNAGTGKNVTVAYTLVDGVGTFTTGAPIIGPGGTIGTIGAPIMITAGTKASNYSLAGETLKADIAQKQVNITEFAAANKTYDGTTTATISNAGKLNGVLEGDSTKVALTNTGATFDTKNAGTGKTVTLNGKALTGDEAKNYVLATTPVTAQADIAQKQLTVTGFAAGNKTYDGNTTAIISNAGTLNGVVQGDAGKVTLTNTGATFDTKNAGTAKTVTLNGKALSGDEAQNYVLATTPVTAQADIAQKQLTIVEFAASNKVYDGNTTATISNAGKLIGVVEGDTGKVALGNTGATFDTKNAGTGKTVTLNGANITGAEAANYTLAPTAVTAKADITKKEITLAGFDAANKVYDGNTVAQIVSSGSLTGVVQNDTVMVSNSGATFDTKNAGTGKTVTLNGVALSGSDAGNYSIANTATDTADITQKAITLTGFDAANKVYDGNTTAQIVSSGSLTGVVQNDTVMVSNSGATFDTKNAGTAKTVTLNGVQLSGTDAGNYSIANTATDTANIAQKQLTIAEFAASNKVYDGNTTATISNAGKLIGVVEGDDGKVVLGNTGATFDTKNAGTGKTVTLNGANITGTESANYLLAPTAVTAKADIAKKEITLAGFDAANKVYDGNTAAQIVSSGSLTGVVSNDTVMVSNSGATFDTKNAGTGKTVTLNGVALSGGDAGNYSIANTATDTADIAQKQLTVTGFAAGNKTYDGNTTATISNAGTLNGVVQSDAGKVALNNTGATFDTKDAGTAKTVTLNGKTLTGDEAKNYVLATTPVTAQANIDRRALSIAGSVVANKTYDGNTVATVTAGTLSGLVQGETLGATTATGQFADKNAGTGKNVTVAYTLANGEQGQASNYSLAGETLKADIAQKQVNITEFAAANKTYDGNTTATISNAGKLNGVLEGDAAKVALINNGATFDTKNAGTGKTVTLNGKALTGDEAKNYVLASDAVTAKADITQKAITLTGFDAANKVYDGNTVAQIVSSGSLTGVVQNDTVMVSNSGATFDTKNAGTAKTVTLNGVQLSGADAGNYSIANTATDTANIAQKQLTIAEFAASNKVYDGNTTATIANAGKLIGVVEGDTGKVALGNTGATFDTKNAATGKTVTLNGANITGTESANYLLAPTAVTAKADITKKEITLAGFDAANKVYDGNNTAQIVSSGSLTGVVQNDTVMVSNSGATFDTKNAGTGKTVTLNGVQLSGTDAANYSIANTATDTADITQKAITLTGFDAANKVYDGNTVAQIVSSGSLTGVVQNDTVMVSNSGATFDTKNAGTGKTVTLNGVQLSGADAGNYSIASTATDTASITQKTITLTGFDAANKVYDGNTTAQIVNSGSLAGVVEKDTVMVSNSGATFDNRNAGTAKTVTLNGVVLSGTDAGNYSIANTATDTADITKRGGVVLTALNKEKQLGEADPALTFEVTGLVQGDSLTGSLSRVAGETPGFYAINRGTVDNSNYEISQFNAGQLQINQSLPQETIATVNTLSSPELRPSLGERPPLDQGGVPQSQAQDTPFLVTPAQANVGGPAQVVVIEGGINLNFAGTSASGSNSNSGNTSEQQ